MKTKIYLINNKFKVEMDYFLIKNDIFNTKIKYKPNFAYLSEMESQF